MYRNKINEMITQYLSTKAILPPHYQGTIIHSSRGYICQVSMLFDGINLIHMLSVAIVMQLSQFVILWGIWEDPQSAHLITN